MTDQVGDLPYRIRIMGEDLVLFRETGGQLGLVHLHCAHRNMSLEFGIIEEGGIRCSYHGWKYGVDGEILDRPCEPVGSRLKEGACLGAYPVVEYQGLAFAYMGPRDTMPPFPVFDTMVEEGDEMIPYLIESPCNWLQVMENAWDPFHVVYLHTKAVRTQFTDAFAEMPRIEYFEREHGDFYTNIRRVGDIVWIRIHDQMLPSVYAERRSLSGTRAIALFWPLRAVALDHADRRYPHDGHRLATFSQRTARRSQRPDQQGRGRFRQDRFLRPECPDRPYELRQRDPGDYDAWASQGPDQYSRA